MERITRNLAEVEDKLVYLASHEDIPKEQSECLLPVLENILAAANYWKLFLLRSKGGG